jgi:hypothetical protein
MHLKHTHGRFLFSIDLPFQFIGTTIVLDEKVISWNIILINLVRCRLLPIGQSMRKHVATPPERFLQKIFGHLVIGNDTIGESIQKRAIVLAEDRHSPSLPAGKGLYHGVVA